MWEILGVVLLFQMQVLKVVKIAESGHYRTIYSTTLPGDRYTDASTPEPIDEEWVVDEPAHEIRAIELRIKYDTSYLSTISQPAHTPKPQEEYEDIKRFLKMCSYEDRDTNDMRFVLTTYVAFGIVGGKSRNYIIEILNKQTKLEEAIMSNNYAEQISLRDWFEKELNTFEEKLRQ